MKIYTVEYSKRVFDRVNDLLIFISSIYTPKAGLKYIDSLYDEINTLSYRADTIPELIWDTFYSYHINEKRLLVKHTKIAVFFHVKNDKVIVDDVVPSKLLTRRRNFTP